MRNEEREKVCGKESGTGGRIHEKKHIQKTNNSVTAWTLELTYPHNPTVSSFDFYAILSPLASVEATSRLALPMVPWPQAYHNGYSSWKLPGKPPFEIQNFPRKRRHNLPSFLSVVHVQIFFFQTSTESPVFQNSPCWILTYQNALFIFPYHNLSFFFHSLFTLVFYHLQNGNLVSSPSECAFLPKKNNKKIKSSIKPWSKSK